jgi:alpha-tubulin suppressor-like RCC1 family protein
MRPIKSKISVWIVGAVCIATPAFAHDSADHYRDHYRFWNWGWGRHALDTRFVFLERPSAKGAAGADLADDPVLLAVDGHGRPQFAPLRGLKTEAYADPECSVPMGHGHLSAQASSLFAFFGIALYERVIETAAGPVYLKFSASGVRAICSSQIAIHAGAADHLVLVGGDKQTGAAGTVLPAPAQARVVDAYENPVSGVPISFTSASGSGSASPARADSDAQGLVSSQLKLGPDAGTDKWTVSRASGKFKGTPATLTLSATATAVVSSPTQLALSGPSSQTAGACSAAFTVRAVNSSGQAVNQSQALTVLVSGLASGSLYEDSACSRPASSATIASGASSASFYLRDDRAETLSIVASSDRTGASPAVADTVSAAAAHHLAFSQQPAPAGVAGQALAIQPVVRVFDAYGNLAGSGGFDVTLAAFADLQCQTAALGALGAAANPVRSASGAASFAGTNYTVAESVYLSASAPGLVSACSQAVAISAAAPSRIQIVAGDDQSGAVGTALGTPDQVKVTDAYGNAVGGAALSFALGQGGGSLSASQGSSDASGLASVSLTLGTVPGESSVIVSGTAGGSVDWADAQNLPSVAFHATALAGAPASLAFAGGSALQAGACSEAYSLSLADSYGNAAPAAAGVSMGLSGQGHGAFFADADCTQPVSVATIAAGASSGAFYFADSTAESVSLAVDASSIGLSAPAIAAQIAAGPADHLSVVAGLGQNGTVGQALAITPSVRVTDAFGNPIAGVSVAFAASIGGGSAAAAAVASDDQGLAASGFTLGTVPGLNRLTASASGLAGSPSSIDFDALASAGAPVSLVLSGPVAQTAGQCSGAFSVAFRDAYGNPTSAAADFAISLSGGGSGAFFASADCGGQGSSSLAVASGAASAPFYFRDTVAESLLIGASAQGLAGSVVPFTVQVGSASQIAIASGDAQSATAGAAVAVDPAVRVTDAFGNLVSSAPVSFVVASGGGSVGSSTVDTDASGIASTRYTLGDAPGANSLVASLASGASVTFSATGTARLPVAIQLAGPSSGIAGACSGAYSLQLADDRGAATVSSDGVSIALSGAGHGAFYADAACAQAVTSVAIAAGGGSAQVYLKDTVAESLSLSAQASGLSAGVAQLAVAAGAASRLAFSVSPSSAGTAGVALAQAPSVQATDAYGNLASGFAADVRLAAYSDPACATAADGTVSAQSNPVTASGGQAAFASVSYNAPGVVYIGASSSGLSVACSSAVSISASLTLAAGTAHTCALKDGGVKCWGFNSAGTLGNGTNVNSNTPQQVSGLASGVIAMGSGGQHVCASTASGMVCWGLNSSGQLGDGTTTNRNTPVPVSGIGGGVSQIVGGDGHTCALLNGSVSCWGDNTYGQLGNGTTSPSWVAVAVQGLPARVRSIAAASVSTCAVLVNGDAYCWGYNDYGQLGDGTTQNQSLPARVQGLGAVSTIAPGVEHTCALVGDQVYCWGRNSFGQLGTGDQVDSAAPRLVQGFTGGVTTLLSGGQNFNCAIVTGGSVQCWGQDLRGQLGDNRASGSLSTVPVQVVGLTSGITALHAGYIHACASNGTTISCWGWGSAGQLGNGASLQSNVPVSVVGY